MNVADPYRAEIGFWPPQALQDAVSRRKLIAATLDTGSGPVAVGFLIHSGIFPRGKIQAVAVRQDYQRQGIAQSLLDAALSQLEAEHFISVSAKPAKDLEKAQIFYEKNQFVRVREEAGGQTRNRQIVVRERLLLAPNLFDQADELRAPSSLSSVQPVDERLWIIDVNVLLDLLKSNRNKEHMAYRLISAALAGRVKVAVTSEFSKELRRSSKDVENDPIFKLALALPTVIAPDDRALKETAKRLHERIFETKKPSQAGTPQALSDCSHIAQAAHGHASAFITSDGHLLESREEIRQLCGIHVAALDDFDEVLAFYDSEHEASSLVTEDFSIGGGSLRDASELLAKAKFRHRAGGSAPKTHSDVTMLANKKSGGVIAYLHVESPRKLGEHHLITLVVDHDSHLAEKVADALIGKALEWICRAGPQVAALTDVLGQPIVRRVAMQQGFRTGANDRELLKLALGTPLTPINFNSHMNRLRLSLGSDVADRLLPQTFESVDQLFHSDIAAFERLEKFLSPSLLLSNHRETIIVPINRPYAGELLGTSTQLTFLEQYGGAYRSEKVYVCSDRKRNYFRRNQMILFYESRKSLGRGGIVAAANVSGVMVQEKSKVSTADLQRTVIESVEGFSSTERVTLVSFNSLLKFPRIVSLERLKKLGAHTSQNFVSATRIATSVGQQILDEGWSNAQ